MCGIIGYVGNKPGKNIVLKGLEALEYRGYDSAGIALIDNNRNSKVIKQVGRVSGLMTEADNQNFYAGLAIGHTRWATHGGVTLSNAHPQVNNAGTVFVVHNGIIENYSELKRKLI
ncbi:MAG: glutamine--fructose-6-phosphate transaminase (isomerizing), partial [Candidatus Saccharimonadales bacterium]